MRGGRGEDGGMRVDRGRPKTRGGSGEGRVIVCSSKRSSLMRGMAERAQSVSFISGPAYRRLGRAREEGGTDRSAAGGTSTCPSGTSRARSVSVRT